MAKECKYQIMHKNVTEMHIFITIHDFWFIFMVFNLLIQRPANYFINNVVNNATLNKLQLPYSTILCHNHLTLLCYCHHTTILSYTLFCV